MSADDQKKHAKFANKYQLPFPLIADVERKIIEAYDVWGKKMVFGREMIGIVRTTFIIDAHGKIERVIDDVETAKHSEQVLQG